MTREMIVSSSAHQTRVAILEDDQLVEVYVEQENELGLAGSIYKGRVTRVLPGMQSAFVNVGLERDAFLYVSDFFEGTEDYEKLPLKTPSGPPGPETDFPVESAEEARSLDSGSRRRNADRRGRRRRRRRGGRGAESHDPRPNESSLPERASEDRKGADQEEAEDMPAVEVATAEPTILPGESLAKYEDKPKPRRETPLVHLEGSDLGAPGIASSGETKSDSAETPDSDDSKAISEEPQRGLPPETPVATVAGSAATEPAQPDAESEPELAELKAAERAASAPEEDALSTTRDLTRDADLEINTPLPEEADESATEAGPVPGAESVEPPISERSSRAGPGLPAQDRALSSEVEDVRRTYAPDQPEDGADRMDDADTGGPQPSSMPGLPLEEDEPSPPSNEVQPTETNAADDSGGTDRRSGGEEPVVNGQPAEARIRSRPSLRYRRGRRGRRGGRGGGPDAAREPAYQEAKPAHPEAGQAPLEPAAAPEAERPDRGGRTSISELVSKGQEIVVQISKEPLGKKGARITSHVALPGRFLVYMPTVEHIGVSRKVPSDKERHRLRKIVESGRDGMPGGFIVRTAGEGVSEEDLREDMSFLHNLWVSIRDKAETSPTPSLLHHDLGIVARILRDKLGEDFKTIWVDREDEYEAVLRFLERFQPNMLKRVKLYTRAAPIFDAFNVTEEIEKALRPRVWLKSGGYIVINQTEALVAIDVNTGKYVGKSDRLEDTILNTNLEAAKEVVRQMRLRDLGGIIVVDFIDMDDRKNRRKLMDVLDQELRFDPAPSKTLGLNEFGLISITRKRVKQSLEKSLCGPCPTCQGAGYIKSVRTVIHDILVDAQKMADDVELNKDTLTLRVNGEVARVLKSKNNSFLQELEDIFSRHVLVRSDNSLHREHYDVH